MKFFRFPWSNSGDKTVIPDDAPVGGEVSYSTGFGGDYELDQDTDPNALDVPREEFNQALFDITESIRLWQTFGVFPFITSGQNGGASFSYDMNAEASIGGLVYRSLINSNTTTPPSSDWVAVEKGYIGQLLSSSKSNKNLVSNSEGTFFELARINPAWVGGAYIHSNVLSLGAEISFSAVSADTFVTFDNSTDTFQAYKFSSNSGIVVAIGTPLVVAGAFVIDMSTYSKPFGTLSRIVTVDPINNEIQSYEYNLVTGVFSLFGNPFSIVMSNPRVTAIDEDLIIVVDAAPDTFQKYRITGNDWVTEGSSLSTIIGTDPNLSSLRDGLIMYTQGGVIRVYDVSSTPLLLASFSITGSAAISCVNDTDTVITLSNGDTFILEFDDSTLGRITEIQNMPAGANFHRMASLDGRSYIHFSGSSSFLDIRRFDFAAGNKPLAQIIYES